MKTIFNKDGARDLTNEEIGKILADETINITKMDMEVNNVTQVDKQKWMYMHLGFYACLKLAGISEEDGDKIIVHAQSILK